MSVESIKQELSTIDVEIARVKSKIIEHRAKIISQAKLFIKERQRKFVEDKIKENAEKTLALGKERVGEIKSRLQVIDEQNDAVVSALFSKSEYWVNIENDSLISPDKEEYEQKRAIMKNVSSNLMLAIRSSFAPIGKLLFDFEFIKPSIQNIYGQSYSSEWIKVNATDIIYGYSFHLPDEFEKALQEHYKSVESLLDLLIKRNDLRKNLMRQEASDLWNEA